MTTLITREQIINFLTSGSSGFYLPPSEQEIETVEAKVRAIFQKLEKELPSASTGDIICKDVKYTDNNTYDSLIFPLVKERFNRTLIKNKVSIGNSYYGGVITQRKSGYKVKD
ncbi:MAG: hypothetical protein K940chlam6_01652 [Chlamydiae bacterium]|nr:hypothetical protein [Chlamydiota bacterium]